MSDFNPEKITLPAKLEGRLFLTYEEFSALACVTTDTIRKWARKGIIKITRFTPRCNRIPIAEVDRLRRGELMEGIK
jgi:hypothetical protein